MLCSTCHFETSALHDHQISLNSKRSKVFHLSSTSIPQSQISLCFTQWTPIYELHAISTLVHEMAPKRILGTRGSNGFYLDPYTFYNEVIGNLMKSKARIRVSNETATHREVAYLSCTELGVDPVQCPVGQDRLTHPDPTSSHWLAAWEGIVGRRPHQCLGDAPG